MIENDYVQSLGYGVGVGEFLPRPVARLKPRLMILRKMATPRLVTGVLSFQLTEMGETMDLDRTMVLWRVPEKVV